VRKILDTTFKLRIGDYRLIIDIDTTIKILRVLKIDNRKNVYEKG